jgi:hypothetical protein
MLSKFHHFIKLIQIHNIYIYMASKSFRYHNRCQFNHESEGISITHANLSYLHCAELPECIAVSKIAGTGPGFRIRYCGTLHTVKSVVRANPSSTETTECLPDIHDEDHRTWPSRMSRGSRVIEMAVSLFSLHKSLTKV